MKDLKRKLRRAHASWTVRFNVAAEAVLEFIPFAAAHFSDLQPYVPDQVFTNVMRVLLAVNLVLRFKTERSLADK